MCSFSQVWGQVHFFVNPEFYTIWEPLEEKNVKLGTAHAQ